MVFFFFFQAEDGIRDKLVTGVQTCALPICRAGRPSPDRLPLLAHWRRPRARTRALARPLLVPPRGALDAEPGRLALRPWLLAALAGAGRRPSLERLRVALLRRGGRPRVRLASRAPPLAWGGPGGRPRVR